MFSALWYNKGNNLFERVIYLINHDIKMKLRDLNSKLTDYSSSYPSKNAMRSLLETIGQFVKVRELTKDEIRAMSGGRGIVGVDGSFTTYGNTFPHVLFLGQALAKCTMPSERECLATYLEVGSNAMEDTTYDVPVINMKSFLETQSQKVAQMEVAVASEALEYHKPFITMFDGGFWRLSNSAEELWEEFYAMTLQQNALCVGVIEDIGSYDLYNELNKVNDEQMGYSLDSNILFNVLEYEEVFIPNALYRDKYVRAFARFSKDPHPIALDFLQEQRKDMFSIMCLVNTLTPKEGRGIPLWIDIVDKDVKITEEETRLMIESEIDQSHIDRFFMGKRNKRTI